MHKPTSRRNQPSLSQTTGFLAAGGLATRDKARVNNSITPTTPAYTQVQSPKRATADESRLYISDPHCTTTTITTASPASPFIASQFIDQTRSNQITLSHYRSGQSKASQNLYQPQPFTQFLPLSSHSVATPFSQSHATLEPVLISAKKKYKPVARKVKPVLEDLPAKFRIILDIKGDPLASLPVLNPHPIPFTPTGRYTQDRKEQFDKDNSHFLLPDERALLHNFMMLHNKAFAWDNSERGHFQEDFFPPIDIPVVPHEPWVERNIRIPPGMYDELCKLVKQKIDAGVFEPSNS